MNKNSKMDNGARFKYIAKTNTEITTILDQLKYLIRI